MNFFAKIVAVLAVLVIFPIPALFAKMYIGGAEITTEGFENGWLPIVLVVAVLAVLVIFPILALRAEKNAEKNEPNK